MADLPMDSALVSTMVQEHQNQPQSKKLHPFFIKDASTVPGNSLQLPTYPHDGQAQTSPGYNDLDEHRWKRRKTEGAAEVDFADTTERSAMSNTQVDIRPPVLQPANEEKAVVTPSDMLRQSPLANIENLPNTSVSASEMQATPPADAVMAAQANDSRQPRKVLKFNMSTGTLGSPPRSRQKARSSLIVCIRYGGDSVEAKTRIGHSITQILEGTLQLPVTPTKKRAKRSRPKKTDGVEGHAVSSPTAHPFFSGKAKAQSITAKPQEATRPSSKPRNTIFMTTPVSPRKQRVHFDASKVAHFGSQKPGMAKVPGAMHPMWPPQGMSHVLGNDTSFCSSLSNETDTTRKSKGQVVTVSRDESVLSKVVKGVGLTKIRTDIHQKDNFPIPPPEELRLPERHFESGRKLRARINSELKSTGSLQQSQCTDDLSHGAKLACHPAITSLYMSLENRLSAYDRSTCENSVWTQKYAPSRAAEVLQASREGPLLKEWLEALKVQSVDTGSSNTEGKPNSKQDKAPKKRKKNQLDGFIVDSDEDADELSCISGNDDEDSTSETIPMNRTVVRNGSKDAKDGSRLRNSVLISGPHGCGKTAAVYAVAKELDFEIFEINSSSRRSGKDLMEKVGDMTRNHLVQQHRVEKATTGDGDEDTAREVKAGKQGMMTSFFKPKPATSGKPSKPVKTADKPEDSCKNSAPKAQKQSLILVEEVDVLYKEDTQFWATLMTMMSQSRRPFILTCNDESLVPIQTLSLHGIFRFSPPPTDLAVDLCLLIAANEGHALKRDAVEAAYASRREDLRATLLDLNYWCQLGVGDRRGGFDWFLLRWPRGCDVDNDGDTVRVVSENTYEKGMGWIGRDAIVSCNDGLNTDEEIMQQLWNLWQVSISDWQRNHGLQPWAQDISPSSWDNCVNLQALEAYDDFCDTMSFSDLCSNGHFGSSYQQRIDATLPDLPSRTRDDYIVGRQLLEADPVCAAACPSAPISQCLASLARHSLLGRTTKTRVPVSAPGLSPLTESSALSTLDASFQETTSLLTRYDLSLAFDPLAVSDRALVNSLDPSVFDRTLQLIVLDVAPWVRGIMAYDNRLMHERSKLSSLLSEGGNGRGRKRMRTTRAALSALEGGERKLTRGEKWFKGVGTGFVMRTGGKGWAEVARAEIDAQSQLIAGVEENEVDMGAASAI